MGSMTLSQEQAFLADICANPDDDGVRLIYADWLTEQDGPGDTERAEFIRGQIEIARLCQDPAAPWTDFRLLERHEYLRSAVNNGDYEFLVPDWTETPDGWWSWYAEGSQIVVVCGNYPSPDPVTLHWQRGFVGHVTLAAADWCRHAERLCATQPIREVTLTTPASILFVSHDIGLVELRETATAEKPFRVVKLFDWIRQRKGFRSQGDIIRWLWPGIVFHGPDFPEE